MTQFCYNIFLTRPIHFILPHPFPPTHLVLYCLHTSNALPSALRLVSPHFTHPSRFSEILPPEKLWLPTSGKLFSTVSAQHLPVPLVSLPASQGLLCFWNTNCIHILFTQQIQKIISTYYQYKNYWDVLYSFLKF